MTPVVRQLLLFGGAWSPRRLGSSLLGLYLAVPGKMWTDAGRTTPAGASDPVQVLDEFSGTNRHLTAAGVARPTVMAGGYGMTFDGIDDGMSITGLSYGLTGLTFCAIASLASASDYPMLLTGRFNAYELRTSSTTRQPEFAPPAATSPDPITLGVRYTLTGRATNSLTAIDIRVNGITKATLAGTGIAVQDSINLGKRADNTRYWPGNIHAAAVVEGYLNNATALKLEKWLARMTGTTM